MRNKILIAAILAIAASAARAQSPAAALVRSGAAAQLEVLAALSPAGSPENLAAQAGRGVDGTRVTIPEAAGGPAGAPNAAFAHDPSRLPGMSRPVVPRPPMLKDPFPRSEDGVWAGAGEYFLAVEKFPLSLLRRHGPGRAAGGLLAALLFIPALIGAAVGAVVGSTW